MSQLITLVLGYYYDYAQFLKSAFDGDKPILKKEYNWLHNLLGFGYAVKAENKIVEVARKYPVFTPTTFTEKILEMIGIEHRRSVKGIAKLIKRRIKESVANKTEIENFLEELYAS